MKMQVRKQTRLVQASREAGQTLIIAVIILGVLLILGVAFATIINRNIEETRSAGERTRAGDAAKAGVEYAHAQMLNSALGADWRPAPTPLTSTPFSRDPDALYLREATYLTMTVNGQTFLDLGGPDYLGPYSRINYQDSRALVRVRYQPNDYGAQLASTGNLRRPGLARGKIVIESVGREGVVNANDPTQLLRDGVRVAGYADQADLQQWIGQIKHADTTIRNTRKTMAVVSLPTEDAWFVMNTEDSSRKIPVGFPVNTTGGTNWFESLNTGILNEGQDVVAPKTFGNVTSVPATLLSLPYEAMPGGGSIHINGTLEVHGLFEVALNRSFGESLTVTDGITTGNGDSILRLHLYDFNNGAQQWEQYTPAINLGATAYASDNPFFSTFGGAVLDGRSQVDDDLENGLLAQNPDFTGGNTREVSEKGAPLITREDPATGLNRYRVLTQQSGNLTGTGQPEGAYGYGEGIYVDASDKGNRASETSRAISDPSRSLPNDWLNPNNVNTKGWVGPYYIPQATYIELLPDGFLITRDSRGTSPSWRSAQTGAPLNQSAMRFFIRRITIGTLGPNTISRPYIISEHEAALAGFNPGTASDAAFRAAGSPFNGTLMVEGDVRVRGVIPTNLQVTLVSMGSIYIEGSITKGITGSGASGIPTVNSTPSSSMLALMARDYVVLNTTMFFGPAGGFSPQAKSGDALPDTPNPVELDLTNPQMVLRTQFLLDRSMGNNPSAWEPLATRYTMPGGLGTTTSQNLPVHMLIQSSADDNGPTFIGGLVAPRTAFGSFTPAMPLLFPATQTFGIGGTAVTEVFNGATPYFTLLATPEETLLPFYGLADPGINAYPKFETVAMPIVNPPGGGVGYDSSWSAGARQIVNVYPEDGTFHAISVEDSTDFIFELNDGLVASTKNFLAARTAMAPFDVRIEATLYAERGSFFVIPGPWFNSNPDDNRQAFEANYTAAGGDDLDTGRLDYGGGANLQTAQQRRFQRFGNSPAVPFYNEPLDVKVTIVGAVVENMPAPLDQQVEWLKKWGWIPRRLGGTGLTIPVQHTQSYDISISGANDRAVPNLQVIYDPSLATGAVPGAGRLVPIRTDTEGRTLPPLPRLPVSPKLAYFGDATP